MEKKPYIVVVGGGASGILAAIMAARNGASVTILEQKEQLGKKILSTGNGKCNYTNAAMDVSFFRGDDVSIVHPVLEQFNTEDTVRFFAELGILPKERNGYFYPKSEQASAVQEVLLMELRRLRVTVCCNTKVLSIQKKERFIVRTKDAAYQADAVILSTGGKASPVLGSDGSGYQLAKAFGHSIRPVVPALVQLHGKGTFFKMVSGVRVDAKISLYEKERLLAEDTGELQLTNYGISGIPVFQVSRYAALSLFKGNTPIAVLDFMPNYSTQDFYSLLLNRREQAQEKTSEEFLLGMFHKKLIPVLLRASKIPGDSLVKKLSNEQLETLARKCKTFSIEIIKTNSFEQAQICAGGVCTNEIHEQTMESKIVNGLYITGELLDIDGMCGGYNLQWAWATGAIAGAAAASRL